MISQKDMRMLLKKTNNKLISKSMASRILKLDGAKTIETLSHMESKGFIEKSEIDEYWQPSIRGKLLANKNVTKEFKLDTLRKQLNDLIDRAGKINSSKEFPDYVVLIKITSEYPIERRSDGVRVIYSLERKPMTEKEYHLAAGKLRSQYGGSFGNIVESLFYPHEAIRNFLKSGSQAIKLRKCERDEIRKIEGYVAFEQKIK